eukprot:6009570-Amphidinium_carterae.1
MHWMQTGSKYATNKLEPRDAHSLMIAPCRMVSLAGLRLVLCTKSLAFADESSDWPATQVDAARCPEVQEPTQEGTRQGTRKGPHHLSLGGTKRTRAETTQSGGGAAHQYLRKE